MSFGKLSPEQSVALIGLGSALRGQDPAQAVFQARGMMEQRRLREEQERQQEEQKRLQEELFKDPKYKSMAQILGPQFAFQQRESDIAEREQKAQEEEQKKLREEIHEDRDDWYKNHAHQKKKYFYRFGIILQMLTLIPLRHIFID